jgi:hypothetical protein
MEFLSVALRILGVPLCNLSLMCCYTEFHGVAQRTTEGSTLDSR